MNHINPPNSELIVIASLTSQTRQNFPSLDSDELMKKLLSMGYQTMSLEGALIDRISDGIFLWVEEDAKFLIQSYLYLEKLIETQEPYQHGAYLNDGILALTAKSNKKEVEVQFAYCPKLDVANLVTHLINISEEEYIWWWRSIAYEIINRAYSN